MVLPSFFVVGAMKAGTTSLFHYLRQHPSLFVPDRQEPNWFSFANAPPDFVGPGNLRASVNRTAVTDRSKYEDLYAPARPGQALVDVSPTYLYVPEATERIRTLVPDPKAVAILRNPVERAFSSFMHAHREQREPINDFLEALAAEPDRIARNYGFIWRYADMGLYAGQINHLYQMLGRDRVLVLLTEDLASDPAGVCRRVAAFAGVDADHQFDVRTRHNVSGLPRSRLLDDIITADGVARRLARPVAAVVGRQRLRDLQARLRARNLRRQHLDPGVRRSVTLLFRDDIVALSALIDRDLSHWLAP